MNWGQSFGSGAVAFAFEFYELLNIYDDLLNLESSTIQASLA